MDEKITGFTERLRAPRTLTGTYGRMAGKAIGTSPRFDDSEEWRGKEMMVALGQVWCGDKREAT